MEVKSPYNLDFLNNYFTSDEFNFINNANLENDKLDKIIDEEMHNRDIIVNLINNLHNAISNVNTESNKDFKTLLSDVQEIFTKINDNIKFVQELKDTFSKINDDIVKLLINAEEISDNKENYIENIQKLKHMVNDFSIKSNELRSKILLNDIKINTFFSKNVVKKYLSSFDIEINFKDTDSSFDNTNSYSKDKKCNHIFRENLANNIEKELTNNKNNAMQNIYLDNEQNFEENDTLLVSEKLKKVFLPYSKNEISLYLEQYPDSYKSYQDVVNKEFVLSLDYYMKHPVVSRFREAYSLVRDRESKSVIDAFKFAIDIMFHYSLNPVIIAACKTQEQLEHYITCLNKNKLDEFNDFKIKYEITPLA